jgi:Extensin-like protein C-terminus
MTRGVGWYLVGSLILVALTGCNPTWVAEQREPWRGEAEQACLKSGSVKESPSVVLLPPINGPGMCGADFPLKVSMLGEGAPLGYEDEAVRPPSDVPQAAPAYPRQPPQYPANPQYGSPAYPPPQGYPTNAPFAVNPAYPHDTRLPPNVSYPAQPRDNQDDYEPAAPYPDAQRAPAPAPYEPPASYPNAQQGLPPAPYQPSPSYSRAPGPNGPISLAPPGYEPPNADAPGDYQTPLPNYGAPNTAPRRPPSPPPTHGGPFPPSYPGSGQIVPMSPSRNATVATTASVSPPATLACPLVSVLDRWIGEAVQPAAQKWFGQPVTGIRQISAYSCRGMNGNPNAHISEHAFGNALDIASFVLADGRVVTVEHGWHGTPEEQGFLRDVQGAACQMFNTVLAPGANVYHYNHIHVDLMRRARRPVICEPGAVSGDEIASRARARYARRDTGVTGSIGAHGDRQVRPSAYSDDDRGLPDAVAGDD